MGLQPGIDDLVHLGVVAEELGHFHGVGHVPVHAHRQGLQTAQQQPGVEGRDAAAHVPQDLHPRLHHPVRLAHQDTGHGVAVSSDVLGGRMQDDVRAQFQGVLQVGRAEGVVHQHRNAFGLGDFRHSLDVGQNQRRVGGSFQVDQFGVFRDGLGEVGRIRGVDLGDGDAHARQGMREELVGAAV